MTLLLVALGVAMDATAVSGCLALRGARPVDIWKIAFTFGLFQFGMALAGALGGQVLTTRLAAVDHWIAFALLTAVGGKMAWDAVAHDGPRPPVAALTLVTLATLGAATSVDALAVGLTLPALQLGALVSTSLIGLATFVLSLAGAWAGKRLGERFGSRLELLGGLLLVALGCRTVFDHLG